MATEPEIPAQKIVRLKLSEQVLDRIRGMIQAGELKPGDQVPSERSLMARFGVGRPAVREALQSLHTQGLITISHGERSRVNELSADRVLDQSDTFARLLLEAMPGNLEHLKQARRMFEVGIVRTAAQTATPEAASDLRGLIARQREKLGDAQGFVEADMAFHTAIADILENPVISAASTAMLRWLREYHTSLLHWSGKEHVTLAEHEEIVCALEANDAKAAGRAMERHLDRSQDLFLSKKSKTNQS